MYAGEKIKFKVYLVVRNTVLQNYRTGNKLQIALEISRI